MKKSKRLNHYIRLACLTGALFCYSASAFAVGLPNIQLPENGKWIMGGSGIINEGGTGTFNNNTMNISQNCENAVIKWGKFSIGSIATVNFERQGGGNFNILNYDAGGTMSQIRGTLKAENGNVFIVNPAGVFIGNSAQVDVGSLYVSNKKLNEDVLGNFNGTAASINNMFASDQPATPAELMSLGHINASNVTFDGNRIVLDTEMLTTNGLENKMQADNILIKTNSKDNVVIGYDAYNVGENKKTYAGKNDGTKLANLEDASNTANTSITKADGYMWVRDLEQLQAMNTNKSGNYALRNGIGAISTKDTTFVPIGDADNPFTGKLDGLEGNVDGIDFAIFDLHVTGNNKSNLGLFGKTEGAEIRNVLLTGGEVTGTGTSSNIGALVGSATNTTIENVRNSINVSGTGETSENIGGIVGKVEDAAGKGATKISDILNAGNIKGFANVGGVVGSIVGNTDAHAVISGAENIGPVQGVDKDANTYSNNIGGIAGSASNTDISNVENNLQIVGGYNVGGIVGSGANVNITNAVNNADVTATGYTEETYKYKTEVGGKRDKNLKVNVANVGGIAGSISGNSQLDTITNEGGDISTKFTSSETYGKYYHAGNVGGIVGSAVGSGTGNVVTITNAENKENTVVGAHNVGGVAGYLEHGTITLSSNNGGEITGTGARTSELDYTDVNGIKDYENNFAYESIRYRNNERFLIGNMGGIVGYMYGDNAFVSQSGNRGNVHSQKIDDGNITLTAKAANVGGIVGRINRDTNRNLTDIIANESTAAVYDCYNRGDIQGYTGVGGVIGLMYKGAVAASDNSGTIRATRQSSTAGGSVEALNMGGIVGDTTEEGEARAVIYDVHNDGVIGSEQLTDYYGRHVGGVVGRLSGEVEKAYNTGAIYNGYNVVGGIAGYMAAGSIKNSFNIGNITVYNQNNATSQVGGIVGGLDVYNQIEISNVYNLGILRSFKGTASGTGNNSVGGIVGGVFNWTHDDEGPIQSLTISNVYTLGNLYSFANGQSDTTNMRAIVGGDCAVTPTIENAYYIKPQISVTSGNAGFRTLTDDNLNGATSINFADRTNWRKYNDFGFSDTSLVDDTTFNSEGAWRIYNYEAPDKNKITTTPILNAFMPKSSNYFGTNSATGKTNRTNIHSVQYGTAYNPLLTIINAEGNGSNTISFAWNDINPDRSASFAVFNGNLKIDKFDTKGNLYGGTLYAKGDLSINNVKTVDGSGNVTNSGDVLLGSGAKLYGSTINVTSGTYDETTKKITSGGKLVNYGKISSTGQVGSSSNVNLRAEGDVEIIGEVTSNGETNVVVPNVGRYPTDPGNVLAGQIIANIADKDKAMPSVGDYYSRSFTSASQKGDVTITSQNGDVSVLLGVAEKGVINTSNNLTITGQNVYVDSDLSIKGSLALKATDKTVLDITNIGAVNTNAEGQEKAREAFVTHFKTINEGDTNANDISFSNTANAMITMDLWDTDSFKLSDHTTLGDALRKMKVEGVDNGFKLFHIWIDDVAALKGINNSTDNNILTYNFALKNNIDATEVTGFEAIGTKTKGTQVFSGNFNGRGNTIVGLSVDNDASAGLFSEIGTNGKVSDLNIYSSSFNGAKVGAVAGINQGTIDNVTTFGNRVNSDAVVDGISSAGGIVGVNNGTISNAVANDAVANSVADEVDEKGYAGGIAGMNQGTTEKQAKIDNSVANSDITVTQGTHALGGIVGINSGNALIDTVRSLGIVNGNYTLNGKVSNDVGGIAGINEGGAQINKAYNVAHVSGGGNVGGIIGSGSTGTLEEVVSAGDITSTGTNAGGIIGKSINMKIDSGRNTGEITGVTNVGGIVGNNDADSNLKNIINDANATIKGVNNVGGLVGTNAGKIEAQDMGLVNDGRVYGVTNVGGIAGVNEAIGEIKNTNSNITLYVNDEELGGKTAQYFGGVAGRNEGTITNATNTGSVLAEGASYVGGITGVNGKLKADGTFEAGKSQITGAGNSNSGKVVGAQFVGGVAGLNVGSVSGTDSGSGATTIENKGIVIATDNGAGGVFGENRTNISNAILKNSGIVVGYTPDGTGGIIGLNSGNINNSDLINTVDGLVVGKDNVGGLIGINKGTIAGGRDASDSYYAHQVYNNGTVIGGKGQDTEPEDTTGWTSKTITDDKGNPSTIWYQVDTNSYDIGGLIGSNGFQNVGGTIETGSLTAGYNTGVVNGGTNVGGVVGNNVNGSTVDQVFNAGKNVTGATGKVVGKVVGYNDNNGTVKNAYDMVLGITDKDGKKVIGGGTEGITEEKEKWTTYGNGNNYGTNKLLSVFLTKINFVPNPDNPNAINEIVYNAHKQNIIVKAVDNVVKVYNKDGLGNEKFLGYFVNASNNKSNDAKAAHSLADFLNSKIADGTNVLLEGNALTKSDSDVATNADTYYRIFNTQQINTGDGKIDPNNLGFDITDIKKTTDGKIPPNPDDKFDKVTVNKAQISLTLKDIWRIYGDAKTIYGDDSLSLTNPGSYSFDFEGKNITLEENETMLSQIKDLVTVTKPTDKDKPSTVVDGALKDADHTQDVGNYNWSLQAILDASKDLSKNYELVKADGKEFNETEAKGVYTANSHVLARKLTLSDFLAKVVYGNNNETVDWSKKLTKKGTLSGVVNGDVITIDLGNAKYTVGGDYASNKGDRYTADVKDSYEGDLSISNIKLTAGENTKLSNYTFDGKAKGDIKVERAQLTITVDSPDQIKAGEDEPKYNGGYSEFVNGDNGKNIVLGYDLDPGQDPSVAGKYDIGVNINGNWYFQKTTKATDILGNYYVTITPGTLTVTDSGTKPDPDPGPDDPHNWQAEDKYPWYQWDKQRNERERKAEVHFVDGGMHVEA